MGYILEDLVPLFGRLGLEPGAIVYVISALWRVPGYDGAPDTLAQAYYEALRRAVGEEGTIVVPTHSQNLCNSDVPFDLDRTPSHERGILSEYVRLLPDANRSFHPFNSYAAVGPRADEITAEVSRHAYGPFTPEARMIELGARTVTIGLPPNFTTTIHHVEQVMAVPYRYTKEFMHPVIRDGVVNVEPFYLYVWYREADLHRSLNRPLLTALEERMEIRSEAIGRGRIYSYRSEEYFRHSLVVFKEDPYVWCATPPTVRPWQR